MFTAIGNFSFQERNRAYDSRCDPKPPVRKHLQSPVSNLFADIGRHRPIRLCLGIIRQTAFPQNHRHDNEAVPILRQIKGITCPTSLLSFRMYHLPSYENICQYAKSLWRFPHQSRLLDLSLSPIRNVGRLSVEA